MVVLSNPGTYGTRKCSSWRADIHKSKDPEYKHLELQHSKNPKSKNKNVRFHRCKKSWIFGFLDFWILGFLDFWTLGFWDFWIFLDFWSFGFLGSGFWIFGFLCFTLVFPICRNSSKIGFGKNGVCVGIYSVFKGCACRRGGYHIYLYIYIHTFIRLYIHIYRSLSLSRSLALCGGCTFSRGLGGTIGYRHPNRPNEAHTGFSYSDCGFWADIDKFLPGGTISRTSVMRGFLDV